MPIEARVLEPVFGGTNTLFVEPTFPFEVKRISGRKMTATFTPPVDHAMPTRPFYLTVQSDVGGISITPFQVPALPKEGTPHVVGGVIIGMGGEEKLIQVFLEHPVRDMYCRYLGDGSHTYLLKVQSGDPNILVKPTHERHRGKPYVLENNHIGEDGYHHGLQLAGNGLEITYFNGVTLVERQEIKKIVPS